MQINSNNIKSSSTEKKIFKPKSKRTDKTILMLIGVVLAFVLLVGYILTLEDNITQEQIKTQGKTEFPNSINQEEKREKNFKELRKKTSMSKVNPNALDSSRVESFTKEVKENETTNQANPNSTIYQELQESITSLKVKVKELEDENRYLKKEL